MQVSFFVFQGTATSRLDRKLLQAEADQVKAILTGLRSAKRIAAPHHEVKVAGVTQNNRQAALALTQVGELVMFLPEPENEHDEDAVAIIRLQDRSCLGYLPRTQQEIYNKGQVQFGRISDRGVWVPGGRSSGMSSFFAKVTFQPALPPLHAPAIPSDLQAEYQRFMSHFTVTVQKFVEQRPWVKTNARCVFSGATNVPLSPVPLWLEDPKRRAIILEGVEWMATVLAEAREKLLSAIVRDTAAEDAFQFANAWTPAEVSSYRWHQTFLQARRAAEENPKWTLDLSIMSEYA